MGVSCRPSEPAAPARVIDTNTATLYLNAKRVAHGRIEFACPTYVVIDGRIFRADFSRRGTRLMWDR